VVCKTEKISYLLKQGVMERFKHGIEDTSWCNLALFSAVVEPGFI